MKKIVSLCLMLAMSMMMWADQALFLVPNSNWLQADAKFAVYYFGGDNTPANGWSDIMFAQPDETNVYMTYIPEGYTNVIFVRLNSTATAGSFAEGVKWNQTADIALPVDGRDMMTLEDGWDNISGTWSIHGLVPEPQDTTAVEVNYYIKNNWNNAAWTWLQMESNANGIFYSAMGVFGGSGVNINTAMSDEGAVWYPVDSMHVIGEQVPAALDTVVFHYYPATTRLTAQVMGSHAVEPQPIEVNYYIKNNWDGAVDWTWQPMAWTADSLACTYTGVFGGTGVNINTERSDNGSMWFTVADMAIGIGGRVPQAGDTVLFTFTIGMHTLAAEVLGRSGVEPQPAENYYIKNNWNGAADWTWQLMEALPGEIWQYVDVYGGTGVNVNTVAEDNGAIWFAESDWDIANNFVPQAGDTLMFWFIPADTLLRVHLIGRPGGDPLPVENHYYLIGNYNEWNIQTSQEFTKQGDIYTITIDTLFGEFKVMTTRSWNDLSYGRGDNDGVLTMGEAYAMVEWASDNMSIEGIYTNAVLNLQVTENAATLTFVSGTLVEDPVVVMVEVRLVPGVWDKDGAKFAAITWKEGETMEMDGVFTDWMVGTDTVSTMIPADADSIAFGRLNPEAEEPAMEYVWNHTDKLAIDPSLIYTITGWGEAGEDCSTGYWGEPEPIEPEGLEEIAIEGKEALKALENGVLYIYRNGKKYNVQGQVVR